MNTTLESKSQVKKWLPLAIILLPNLMISLNTYMLQIGLPIIQKDLHASFSDAQLILSGYAIGLATTLMISGKLGDLFGRKRLLTIGVTGFFFMALIGGLTHSIFILIVVRLFQGIFGACIQPQVLVLMKSNFAKEEQPLVFSIYGAMIGIGFTFGLMLGGFIIHLNTFNLGWRNIFFVNMPLCLVILLGLKLIDETIVEANKAFDIIGSSLFIGSILLCVLSLFTLAKSTTPLRELGLICLAIILFIVFYHYEKKQKLTTKPHLIDFVIFKEKNFATGMLAVIFVYINMFSLFFLITYYAQNGLDYTVPQTSLVFLPLGLSFIATSLLSARWVRKKGNLVLIWGATFMGVSTILLCLSVRMTPQLLAPQNILLLFLYGAALGMTTTPLVGIVLIDLKAQYAGIGAAMLNTIMYLANALGVCFISFIFSKLLAANTYSTQLDNYAFSFSRSLIATAIFAGLTTWMLLKMTRKKEK